MFGRTTKDASSDARPEVEGRPGSKGRATPTRREAEAAARERARAGVDKKAAAKMSRQKRAEANAKMREGMRTGDERYLMDRDRGPVKRFVRDYVDARISFMEFLFVVLIVIFALQSVSVLRPLSLLVWYVTIVALLVDVVWLNLRLGAEIRRRFGDTEHSTRGWRFYAFMRAIQLRRLRMPKPQRKWREKLPEHYR